MKIIQITDVHAWDAFISTQPGAQFTQSASWGAFQESEGRTVVRIAGLDDQGEILIAAQWLLHKKRIGSYWYAQRGPIIRHDVLLQAEEIVCMYIHALQKSKLLSKGIFLRIEPPIEQKQDSGIFSRSYIQAHAYQPAATSMIDLTKDEQELLDNMHEKTRYNVRLADRKGVSVRVASSDEDIQAFLQLNKETASRDKFISRSDAYIKRTVQTLRDVGMSRIRIAEYNNEPLAMSIEISFGDTVTYLYGASGSQHRNVMAPYALHWHAIQQAKKDGFRFYDLYGVNPANKESFYYKKTWEGITRFKKGWGGTQIDYIGTWECPVQPFFYAGIRLMRFIGR